MNDNESQVEMHLVAVLRHSEITPVERMVTAVVGQPVPHLSVDSVTTIIANNYLIDIVFRFVERIVHLTSAIDRYLVFAGEASHY